MVIAYPISGPATEGSDFATITTHQVTITAGTTADIDIDVSDKGVFQGTENVIITFDSITDVKVAGSTGDPFFISFIDPVDGEGPSLPGVGQLKNLTGLNLDTIIVQFSDDLQQSGGADVGLDNLSLAGLNSLDHKADPGLTTSNC